MATWTLASVRRPKVHNDSTDEHEDAAYLVFKATSSTGEAVQGTLAFADYATLEAEWEAGTATTVLDASVDDWLTNNAYTDDDAMPSPQTSGKEGYSFTE